jgi:pre-rRNA-processing protein TSR4
MLVLLLQLNGDLPAEFPGHERRLYIFGCRSKTCRRKDGSIRVVRGTRIDAAAAEAAERKETERKEKEEREKAEAVTGKGKVVSNTSFGDSLFGKGPAAAGGGMFNSNPFSTSASGGAQQNPFAKPAMAPLISPKSTATEEEEKLPQSFATALNLNNTPKTPAGPPPPPQPWPPANELPKPYPKLFLSDADYETLDKAAPQIDQKVQIMDVDEEFGGGPSTGKEDKSVYESSMDKSFQKFADRLAQNPEQVLRYEWKGSPLLYNDRDAVGKLLAGSEKGGKVQTGGGISRVPKCANCGAARVFEAQLAPNAIAELESEELSLDEGMEWGTIIVGVCSADCVPVGPAPGAPGYLEEWAGVQWEEVGGKR